jgi:hypothetical protein
VSTDRSVFLYVSVSSLQLQTGLYPGNAALDTKVVSIWQNWCKPRKVKIHKEKKKPLAKKKKQPLAITVRAFVDCDHNDSRARVHKTTIRVEVEVNPMSNLVMRRKPNLLHWRGVLQHTVQ